MKVFLDDERATPEGWTGVKTPEEAIELLKTDRVTHLSVDHDLGLSDDRTGYTVLLWIEEQCAENAFRPPSISIHSANAGARRKMDLAVESIRERGRQLPPEDQQSTESERFERYMRLRENREEKERTLLANLKNSKAELATLLEKCSDNWGYEDPIYRFYHQSFKVFFNLQPATEEIVAALRELLPEQPLNDWFLQIVAEGTGSKFTQEMNEDWLRHTRPIVEAFFHARYMLEMAVRYADLDAPPLPLPSGWAAFLYLFNLR
jgi:hypothetical protein